MDFNEIKEKAKTQLDEAKAYVDEKTQPVRTWIGENKGKVAAIGLGLGYVIVKARSYDKGFKKGYKNGMSIGLGENILHDYERKVVSNAINRINDSGDEGVYFTNEDGEEIVVKSTKVERL